MRGDGRAVLVVDDDRVNRVLLSRLLEQEGYTPRTAVDGREALRALAEERFDAVLLDMVMPEVDGLEVLRTVKGDSRLWHIPVIMVSAVEETDSIVACLELGAEDYLLKPFDPVLLRARLNGCLARKRFHNLEAEYQRMVHEQAAELEELKRELPQVRDQSADLERLAGLRRFLPASVVDRLAAPENEAALAPHRRRVVVVSVALEGFSELCVQVTADDALAVLDGFSTVVAALAARFEATLGPLAGSTATVVFNDPLPSPDPVAAALGMATELAEEVAGRLTGWQERNGVELHWRAGVATGVAVCGEVGGEDRRDYVVVGPVVERAAALRDTIGGQDGIVLDEESHAAAGDLVEAQPLAWDDAGGPAAAYRVVLPPWRDAPPNSIPREEDGRGQVGGPTP